MKYIAEKNIKIHAFNNKLKLYPPELITQEILDYVTAHKKELLSALRGSHFPPHEFNTPGSCATEGDVDSGRSLGAGSTKTGDPVPEVCFTCNRNYQCASCLHGLKEPMVISPKAQGWWFRRKEATGYEDILL
jgi:hypothetical protein